MEIWQQVTKYCGKEEKLLQRNKILWKRGEIAPEEQFLLFSTIFSMYFQLQESNYMLICEARLFNLFFSSILQIWYAEVWISLSILKSPLDWDNESRLYFYKQTYDLPRLQYSAVYTNYSIYPKYSTSKLFTYHTCPKSWKSYLTTCWYANTAEWVANSIDFDQLLHLIWTYTLRRPVCLNTLTKYGPIFTSNIWAQLFKTLLA